MTDRLMHYIGQRRSTYRRLNPGEEDLRSQYNELARTVKESTRKVKSNFEIKVSNQAKSDSRRFFLVDKKIAMEELLLLKTDNGELVCSGDRVSKILNEYFLLRKKDAGYTGE